MPLPLKEVRNMKQAIYETKGRAREFCELAMNHYSGCGHRCIYCYGAKVTHQTDDAFKNLARPRLSLSDIQASVNQAVLNGEYRRVLLSFVTDPYQPLDEKLELTRNAITLLHKYGLKVVILTKGGQRSMRDFDLLGPEDAYATTLTCDNEPDSLRWEPGAAPPVERIAALKEAHARGIETWVSFEPVIYPEQTANLLATTRSFVGHYKIGTMNYHPHGKTIDWNKFGWDMKTRLDRLGVRYYFKKDLLKEMRVDASMFTQTWTCG